MQALLQEPQKRDSRFVEMQFFLSMTQSVVKTAAAAAEVYDEKNDCILITLQAFQVMKTAITKLLYLHTAYYIVTMFRTPASITPSFSLLDFDLSAAPDAVESSRLEVALRWHFGQLDMDFAEYCDRDGD